MLVICEKCSAEISQGKAGQKNNITLNICNGCNEEDEEEKSLQDEAFLPESDYSSADYDPYDDNYDELMDKADWPEDDEPEHDRQAEEDQEARLRTEEDAKEDKEAWLAGMDLEERAYAADCDRDRDYDWDFPEDWILSVSG